MGTASAPTAGQLDRLILAAVTAAPVLDLAELRQAMPPRFRGPVFDRAILALADARLIVLAADCHPDSLTAEQRRRYVPDGELFFTTAAPRR